MEDLLFLTHRIPYPPNKGDKIRSYHLLKHLSESYRVHLGTFIDDRDDWKHVRQVQQMCGETHFVPLNRGAARLRSLRALVSNEPLTLGYYRDAGLHRWVERILSEFQVKRIVAFSSAVAQYIFTAGEARRIIDFVDVDSDKWFQYARRRRWPGSWLYRREGRLLLRFERKVAGIVDASLFVSRAEADLFKELAPDSEPRISYFDNGVDTDFFSPDRAFENPYPANVLPIVFTGAMDYWPNADAAQWFAREIFPAVLMRNPGARFYIVGSRPTSVVRALAALPGVSVTGFVPDVRPYLAHARLAVAPLRTARGIQNKVLEAMSMAKPVIASSAAIGGITANAGEEVLVARDGSEFVAIVSGMLEHPLDKIGKAARIRILSDYTWEHVLARFDAFLSPDAPIPSLPVASSKSISHALSPAGWAS
jgi:sugar transferase (PEP-CTERM/EpsH1 system associated)